MIVSDYISRNQVDFAGVKVIRPKEDKILPSEVMINLPNFYAYYGDANLGINEVNMSLQSREMVVPVKGTVHFFGWSKEGGSARVYALQTFEHQSYHTPLTSVLADNRANMFRSCVSFEIGQHVYAVLVSLGGLEWDRGEFFGGMIPKERWLTSDPDYCWSKYGDGFEEGSEGSLADIFSNDDKKILESIDFPFYIELGLAKDPPSPDYLTALVIRGNQSRNTSDMPIKTALIINGRKLYELTTTSSDLTAVGAWHLPEFPVGIWSIVMCHVADIGSRTFEFQETFKRVIDPNQLPSWRIPYEPVAAFSSVVMNRRTLVHDASVEPVCLRDGIEGKAIRYNP